MEQVADHAVPILLSAILAFLVWFGRVIYGLRQDVNVLRTVLVGVDGTNGLRSEVVALRHAKHEHGDALHAHSGRLTLHDYRLDALESRS